MVSFFGMSDKVGNISFYDSSGQSDFGFTKPYSEKTAELIDNEVKEIITESYVRAKALLKDHMKGLTELAELLLEKEVIFSEDLERIFGKRKAVQVKEEREAGIAEKKNLGTGKEGKKLGKKKKKKNNTESEDETPDDSKEVKSSKKSK
jgi:cell division protease FtsH